MMDDKLQEIFDDAERLKVALQKANADELKACPFCKQERLKLQVEQEEWDAARVICRAHRCGATGPWVELGDFETVEDARTEAVRLWNTRPLTGGVTEEMVEAGWEAFNQHDDYRTAMREAYLAMSNAPKSKGTDHDIR